MKNYILLLLLATFGMQAQTLQNPTFGNVTLKNNVTSITATKVNVQDANGVINTIPKSDLVNVVEVNDVPSLPLIGEASKIYVVKNINKIYRWNSTFYQELAVTDISGKINVSEKGVTVATLEGGKIPNSQIPALAISETFPVSSQAQMLALSQADQGDVAIRSDISKSFILRQSPSSVLGNWNELLSPTDAVTSVAGKVGVVTLVKADVGLSNVDNTSDANKPISTATQTALNLKEPSFSKNTAFNKNFGTTAGTVVEGGTLGSNAYSSDAYLPLSGGTVTGNFKLNGLLLSDNFTGAIKQVLYPTEVALFLGNPSLINVNYETGVRHQFYVNNSIKGIFNSGGLFVDGTVTATSFNGSATLTGIPTAPTAPAGTNTTQIATTAFVQANSRPYKVYTALLSQSGSSVPTATVLENTLGGSISFSRVSAGIYRISLTGAFTDKKTGFSYTRGITSNALNVTNGIRRVDNDTIEFNSVVNGSVSDGQTINDTIEIRVYL